MSQLSYFDILKITEKHQKNEKWLSDRYEQLKKDYDGKFIAVDDEKFIGSDDRIEILIPKLKADKKFSPSIIIKLISNGNYNHMI